MSIDSDKYTLIFLHIPKAAGTTMHKIIERQYGKSSIFTMDGARVMESSDEIRSMSDDRKRRIKVLKGHMAYGLHAYMPKPCRYFTVLRDPLERLISHYYYVIRTPEHYLYETVISQKMTLEDYIDSGISQELINGQTRMLASQNGYLVEDGAITENHLNEAKQHLDKSFELVGLAEQFDETLLLCKQAFGWKNVFYSRSNVTRERPARESVSEEVADMILDHNKFDSELYAYARKQFEERKSLYEGDLDNDLRVFRKKNAFYNLRYQTMRKAMKYVKTIFKAKMKKP